MKLIFVTRERKEEKAKVGEITSQNNKMKRKWSHSGVSQMQAAGMGKNQTLRNRKFWSNFGSM